MTLVLEHLPKAQQSHSCAKISILLPSFLACVAFHDGQFDFNRLDTWIHLMKTTLGSTPSWWFGSSPHYIPPPWCMHRPIGANDCLMSHWALSLHFIFPRIITLLSKKNLLCGANCDSWILPCNYAILGCIWASKAILNRIWVNTSYLPSICMLLAWIQFFLALCSIPPLSHM